MQLIHLHFTGQGRNQQKRGRGRGDYRGGYSQGGPPPERGPPRSSDGFASQRDQRNPPSRQEVPGSAYPRQGPPGGQRFTSLSGAPRSAPAPWSRPAAPVQPPPASEPAKPAWGTQTAPAEPAAPPKQAPGSKRFVIISFQLSSWRLEEFS